MHIGAPNSVRRFVSTRNWSTANGNVACIFDGADGFEVDSYFDSVDQANEMCFGYYWIYDIAADRLEQCKRQVTFIPAGK